MSDEELQELFEAGRLEKGKDSFAFQKVYDALNKEPEHHLPAGFADRIVKLLEQKQATKSGRVELVLAVVGGIFTILTLVIAVIMTNFKANLGFLNGVSSYKGVILFGFAFVILLQWLDKIVVRKKESI